MIDTLNPFIEQVSSQDMLPSRAVCYSCHAPNRHVNALANGFFRLPKSERLPDLSDNLWIQFGAMVVSALWHVVPSYLWPCSAFSIPVPIVVGVGAKKKVRQSNAKWIVAFMAHAKADFNFAIHHAPHKSVRPVHPPFRLEESIYLSCTSPDPALSKLGDVQLNPATLVYFTEKSSQFFRGQVDRVVVFGKYFGSVIHNRIVNFVSAMSVKQHWLWRDSLKPATPINQTHFTQ